MENKNYITDFGYEDLPVLLANTYDVALLPPERMATVDDLRQFLESAGVPIPDKLSHHDLVGVHAVREMVRAVFLATSPAQALDQLNMLLSTAKAELHFRDGDGKPALRLVSAVSVQVTENVKSAAAFALAQTVARLGFDRLRSCEADPCRDLFVDASKKGVKRFCSSRCASRTHVATFRSRHAK